MIDTDTDLQSSHTPQALSKPASITLLSGFTLIATVAAFMLLGSIWSSMGWRFNMVLVVCAFALPVILSLRATHWLSHQPQWPWQGSPKTPWLLGSLIGASSLAVLLGACWFWGQWIDLSWDSLFYHKESLIQLAWGWNPLAEPYPRRDYFPMLSPMKNLDYIAHASHAIEAAGAVIYSLTRQVETAKAINTLILLSSGCFAYTFVDQLIPPMPASRWCRELCLITIAAITAFNPVSLSQISILYNDGVITNLLISLLLCAVVILRDEAKPWHGLCVFPCLIVAAATKLTGVFFSGIFIVMSLLWLWRWKKIVYWKGVAGVALCYIISIGFISINPFITDLHNWIPRDLPEVRTVKHPVAHPLGQKHTTHEQLIDKKIRFYNQNKKPLYTRMMDQQSDPTFLSQPSLVKFFQSLNATPNVYASHIPPWHNPFKVSADSWYHCRYPDLRLGGLGAFFAMTWWLSLLALPWFFVRRHEPIIQAVSVGLGMLLVSVAVFPESWWMRFVGFFSLWPILITLGLLAVPYRWKTLPVSAYLCVVLLTLMTLNSIGVGVTRLSVDWDHSQAVHTEMTEIKQMDLPYGLLAHADVFGSFRFLPYEANLPFHTLLSPCPSSLQPVHPIRIKNELFQLRMFPFFYNKVCYLEGMPKGS